jgi:hypothetical protein
MTCCQEAQSQKHVLNLSSTFGNCIEARGMNSQADPCENKPSETAGRFTVPTTSSFFDVVTAKVDEFVR